MDQSPLLQNDKQHLSYWKELPENTRVMLISAIYSGENQKVQLKFYDPNLHVIYFWQDKTDHKPYCYTKLEYKKRAEEIASIKDNTKNRSNVRQRNSGNKDNCS